jgi:hypothetical protein
MALIECAQILLEEECVRGGRRRHLEVLSLLVTAEDTVAPYNEIAGQLETTEGAIKVAVHRLRRRFHEILRNEILQTVTIQRKWTTRFVFCLNACGFNVGWLEAAGTNS